MKLTKSDLRALLLAIAFMCAMVAKGQTNLRVYWSTNYVDTCKSENVLPKIDYCPDARSIAKRQDSHSHEWIVIIQKKNFAPDYWENHFVCQMCYKDTVVFYDTPLLRLCSHLYVYLQPDTMRVNYRMQPMMHKPPQGRPLVCIRCYKQINQTVIEER